MDSWQGQALQVSAHIYLYIYLSILSSCALLVCVLLGLGFGLLVRVIVLVVCAYRCVRVLLFVVLFCFFALNSLQEVQVALPG